MKLSESTNVIEVHYCSLTPGTDMARVTGSSATIGVQRTVGARFFQHALNTAGSISSGAALRFTPVP